MAAGKSGNNSGLLEKLRNSRDMLRYEWRSVREKKIHHKDELLAAGKTVAEVRHDRVFRQLVKEQRRYSVLLSQLDRKISKHLSRYPGK